MSQANPLRGAPRINGDLLKLGIEISQAAVLMNTYTERAILRLPGFDAVYDCGG